MMPGQGRQATRVVALLLLAAASVTPVATAAEPTWNLYGRLSMGYGWLDDGVDRGPNLFDRGSHIGLSGRTPLDLGDGPDAPGAPDVVWQIETGLDPDQGSGSLASRDTYLGLEGEWGRVQAGHFRTPTWRIRRRAAQLWSRVGDNRSFSRPDTETGAWDGQAPGWDQRYGNSLGYTTPQRLPVYAEIHHSANFDEEFGNVGDGAPAYSTALHYDDGPFWIGVGYERIDGDSDAVGPQGADRDGDPRLFRVAATYDLAQFQFAAFRQDARYQQGIKDWDRTVHGAGLSYRPNLQRRFSVEVMDAGELDATPETGARSVGAEYEYAFTPQTRLYFSVLHVRNDDRAQFSSNRGELDDADDGAGRNSTSVSVLARHHF